MNGKGLKGDRDRPRDLRRTSDEKGLWRGQKSRRQ